MEIFLWYNIPKALILYHMRKELDMFEKLTEYWAKMIKKAYHTIMKSKKKFLPLFLSLLLIQCIIFTVFLAFHNNVRIHQETVRAEYDYHLVLSGLTEAEMLLLNNDNRTGSRRDMCFDVVKIMKYDSTYFDPMYAVYVELITGNKDYGLFAPFIDDSLEVNYNTMRLRYPEVFESKNLAVTETPLFTEEEEISALKAKRNTVLALLSLASVLVLASFYSIYTQNQKHLYGLYGAFGGTTRTICTHALTEMLLTATLLLLPSYYISALICYLVYHQNSVSFTFSFISIKIWLIGLLIVFLILFLAVTVPIRCATRMEPMRLITSTNNANLVSFSGRSLNLLKKKFPLGYEAISAWRFKRHHISLAVPSALLCVLFVLGFYFSAIYENNADIRRKTDYDFSINFQNNSISDEKYIDIFEQADGVERIHASFSTQRAELIASLLVVADRNVSSAGGLAEDAEKGLFYTGDALFFGSPSSKNLAEYIGETYTVRGDVSALAESKNNIIIGSTYQNTDAFSFELGDTVQIAIPEVDDEGDIVWVEGKGRIEETASSVSLWEQQYEKISMRFETFTIVAIIEDFPSGAQGVPLILNSEIYEAVTGNSPVSDSLLVYTEEDLSFDELTATEGYLRQIATKLGNGTVHTYNNRFYDTITTQFCYGSFLPLAGFAFFCFVPLHWFYSQALFFRRRENEFYVLSAISASPSRIRSLFLSGCLMQIPIGIFSTILSLLASLLVYLFVERFLPNVLSVGGDVLRETTPPIWVFMLCLGVTLLSSLLSAFFPYLTWRKRFISEKETADFSDAS